MQLSVGESVLADCDVRPLVQAASVRSFHHKYPHRTARVAKFLVRSIWEFPTPESAAERGRILEQAQC